MADIALWVCSIYTHFVLNDARLKGFGLKLGLMLKVGLGLSREPQCQAGIMWSVNGTLNTIVAEWRLGAGSDVDIDVGYVQGVT